MFRFVMSMHIDRDWLVMHVSVSARKKSVGRQIANFFQRNHMPRIAKGWATAGGPDLGGEMI